MTRHKIIFDTDPGVDDAMALLFIEASGGFDLLGITTVLGNGGIDTVTRNALYMKERFGIAAPVAKGAAEPIEKRPHHEAPHVHGQNGLGDAPVPDTVATAPDPRPAWRLIVDTVRAHPGEVTLIAVGRMTNLALALEHDPEIAGLVKGVAIMGGAFGINGHTGNATPVAEANILGDPEAADRVLTANWPVTVIGLDVTHETVMTPAYMGELRDRGGERGRFMWDISRGYERFYRERVGLAGICCHDSLAVAAVLDPGLFTLRAGPVRVATEGIALGQTIQKFRNRGYRPNAWDGYPAQSVAVAVDSKRFLERYLAAFAG